MKGSEKLYNTCKDKWREHFAQWFASQLAQQHLFRSLLHIDSRASRLDILTQ